GGPKDDANTGNVGQAADVAVPAPVTRHHKTCKGAQPTSVISKRLLRITHKRFHISGHAVGGRCVKGKRVRARARRVEVSLALVQLRGLHAALRLRRTIRPVSTRRWRPRAAALLAGGAFALHQLRYLLGYGSRSHHELAAQGHAYLTVVAPLIAVVLLLAAADVLMRITRARPDGLGEQPSLRRLWAVAAGFLFSAYCLQ